MAENHPVGFQWVVEAERRGATVIHADPRFTRTSALADIHVPIRPGSDIAFVGGLINYVISHRREFRDYVVAYTNAATIIDEAFRDTEDLDGLFSGWDPQTRTYDSSSWQYEGVGEKSAAGDREDGGEHARGGRSGSAPRVDPTLEHPHCAFQLLKRHFSRYTPEMVQRTCGVPVDRFIAVAEAMCANSGRERTGAICYAVGWTHHSVGVQNVRAAAILQTLLGNIGRPGGGVMALRGHASIQGSTDIPTLFDLLPGYIPMPHVSTAGTLDEFIHSDSSPTGYWGNMRAYTVSLLKAWFGDAATADNDFCFDHLPRLTGDHSTYQTTLGMIAGTVKGFFLLGENPAVGSTNSGMHRKAMANLDWLVVRDLQEIESASFWYDAPEIATGELRTEAIGTEVFLMPAADHTEKSGSFTQTQRLLQWHDKAVEPVGNCRSDLLVHLPPRSFGAGTSADVSRCQGSAGTRSHLGLRTGRSAPRPVGGSRTRRDQWPNEQRQPVVELHGTASRRLDDLRLLDLLRMQSGRCQPDTSQSPRHRTVMGGTELGMGMAGEPPHAV